MQRAELYLTVTEPSQLNGLVSRISQIADHLPLACVLFAFEAEQSDPLADTIKALHQLGCPSLTLHAPMAVADGVHFHTPPGNKPKDPDLLVGLGPATDRHQALEWAETGIDYVWFGRLVDEQTEIEAIELAHWWAQFVEVPCVLSLVDSGAPSTDLLLKGLETGADYIAMSLNQLASDKDLAQLGAIWTQSTQHTQQKAQ